MIAFLLRLAHRAVTVQKYRFLALASTITVATALLVTLTSLYLNAEAQLKTELSGIPNLVIEPRKSLVTVSPLQAADAALLKSKKNFWHNNILNAVPVHIFPANGKNAPQLGATWFDRQVEVDGQTYRLGILHFPGWSYQGNPPAPGTIIAGKNTPAALEGRTSTSVQLNGREQTFAIGGVISTGSYWDDFLFIDWGEVEDSARLQADQILVSALIKPADQLAMKAEVYGEASLNPQEYEAWYCSPYVSSVAGTVGAVLPGAQVRVLRRITEVQEGLIQATSGVLLTLLGVSFLVALLAVFSAEKMYLLARRKELAIMTALGANRRKCFSQLMIEILLAALIAALLITLSLAPLTAWMSREILTQELSTGTLAMAAGLILPFAVSLPPAMLLIRGSFQTQLLEFLR